MQKPVQSSINILQKKAFCHKKDSVQYEKEVDGMQFQFLGISYKKANLDIRDKTSFTDNEKIDFLQRVSVEAGVIQCMILSTCNRSEIYYIADMPQQKERMKRLYCEAFPEVDVCPFLEELEGEEAIFYVYRVTSGMESQVLGEDQILGQVRDALDFSRTMGSAGKELNKIIRDAVTCAKRMKTALKISEIPLSVSYVGIRQIQMECSFLGKTVLLIGSGKMALLALQYIYEYQAGEVYLCSRTLSHAKEVKQQYPNLKIVTFEDRYEVMQKCDVVISATASPHIVLQSGKIKLSKETYFLDLATPRDIDPKVDENAKAHLINLDLLQQRVEENQKERRELLSLGEQMIQEDMEETMNWLFESHMDGTIASLNQKCQEIEEDSCNYLNRKMDLNEREKKILRKTIHASLHRLLKEPIEALKLLETSQEQEQYKEMIEKLFQL